MEEILFNKVSFGGNELTYLQQAVANAFTAGNGPFTRQAESMLAQIQGSGRVLLTTSCTHALEMSARLIDIGPGDEVIVPAYTFVSTASAFMIQGGKPVFADVRNDTLNLDPAAVEPLIGPRTKAICLVHYAGIGDDVKHFAELAARHGIALIEDNAHGLGGTTHAQMLGSFGSLSSLSFHETKNVTCGEGGALIINDDSLVERAEILREKGTDRTRFLRGQVDKYTWVDVGSSWVMSDLLAAILVGQLERFAQITERRIEIWDKYHAALASWAGDQGVLTPVVPAVSSHTGHMYALRLDSLPERSRFISQLSSMGVPSVFHYQALNVSKVGRQLGGREGECPVSEKAADTLVRLPLHIELSDSQQDRIIEAVQSFRR